MIILKATGSSLLLAIGLLFHFPVCGITFDGAETQQTIEGVGVNLNYRGWEGTNLLPVLNAYMNEAGSSLFRVPFDLSDWEAINDDTDSNAYNWAYYNGIYGSTEFNRLWDMIDHLNQSGYSNRVCLTFMGWGPAWMMDGDGRSLKPGMEDEWAEMIASALIYARNVRGVQLSFVTPNNEPDIYDEGIRITQATQYTNTIHRLVKKLDAAGLNDLWLVGPCRAGGPTGFLPEMTADPLIMSRLKHFSIHTYNKNQGNTAAASAWIANSAYSDRSLWVTEYNEWCATCDTSDTGFFDIWSNARETAAHLFHHLQAGASAALAWEGYDSIYAHHYTNWGYFGLMQVNDINAATKTYSPRKNFYTVAQVSKWVRPGAERIDVSEPNSWPFSYLTAFKHEVLGQFTICGINFSGEPASLSGLLTNLGPMQRLSLHYTSATTNLAYGGEVPVGSNGTFTATIPGDCVFTLVGFDARPLTNGVTAGSGGVLPGELEHFYLDVTNPVLRAQFDVLSPSADVSLFVQRDVPSDGVTLVAHASHNPGSHGEQIVLRTTDHPKSLKSGRWFVSVKNNGPGNAMYQVKAWQHNASGLPLYLNAVAPQGNQVCLNWNSLPGASYVVQGAASVLPGSWIDLSGTLYTSNTTGSFCLPLDGSRQFFRIMEGVSEVAP
jgi:hypothetical protein